MTDKKISALTTATTPLAGTEVLPIVQSGSTVKVSVANLTTRASVDVGNGTNADLNLNGTAATNGLAVNYQGGGSGNPTWDVGTKTATTNYTIGYTLSSSRTVLYDLDANGNITNLGAVGPSAALTNASSTPIASKIIGAMKPLKVTLNDQVAGTGGTFQSGMYLITNTTDNTHAIYVYTGFVTSAGYAILASSGSNWSTSYNAAGKEGLALNSGGDGPYFFSNLGGSKVYQIFCFGGA